MMRIEIKVWRLVNDLTSTVAAIALAMVAKYSNKRETADGKRETANGKRQTGKKFLRLFFPIEISHAK